MCPCLRCFDDLPALGFRQGRTLFQFGGIFSGEPGGFGQLYWGQAGLVQVAVDVDVRVFRGEGGSAKLFDYKCLDLVVRTAGQSYVGGMDL